MVVAFFEFVVLYIFWLVISGRFEIKYLVVGALAAGLVTFLTHDLLYNPRLAGQGTSLKYLVECTLHAARYFPWLVWEIFKASIQVAVILLHRKIPIDPALFTFETRLRNRVSQVSLANSITLTPGTITVDLKNNQYLLHCLFPQSAGSLENGVMQNKVARIFGDNLETTTPKYSWAHSFRDLEK
ncbi:MAG TPA: Na+/H+ antiporter subunit E [Dehalococcoidales bacterium]|nr:Na+/H+ antiporter subunit E [Dehalococcoidales bacterium]